MAGLMGLSEDSGNRAFQALDDVAGLEQRRGLINQQIRDSAQAGKSALWGMVGSKVGGLIGSAVSQGSPIGGQIGSQIGGLVGTYASR